MVKSSTLEFLKNLAKNNNREWFQANRKEYENAKADFEQLCQEILDEIIKIRPEMMHTKVKDCIFRINRDVRFSKDKSPYKKHFAAAFGVGGRNAGSSDGSPVDFYFHFEPDGESMIGGGMWQPSTKNLAKFRQEIDYNAAELKSIIFEDKFRNYFKEISGEKVKRMPKGYPIDHPEIELLRYKELFFLHRFSDDELTSSDFVNNIMYGCNLLQPYILYLNYLFNDENETHKL